MGFSAFIRNKLLDHAFKTAAFTQPTHVVIALSTTDPGNDGSTITEPVGNGYARVNCDAWDASVNGAIQNTGAVQFATATGSWGTISHFAIFDNAGNFWGSNVLKDSLGNTTTKTIGTDDTLSFPAGALDITLT